MSKWRSPTTTNRQAAEILCKEVQEQGGETVGFQQDVTDFEGAKAVLAAVKERFGRIDMLVNNAGITRDKPLAMMQEADWRTVIETNLYGTINFSRAAVYAFMKQRSGRIVNITSVSGQTGLPGQTNYSASKAGIIGFTKALAKEVAKKRHHSQRRIPRIHHHGYAAGDTRTTPPSAACHHPHGALWPAQRGGQSGEISPV